MAAAAARGRSAWATVSAACLPWLMLCLLAAGGQSSGADATKQGVPLSFDVAVIRPSQADGRARSHIYSSPGDGHFQAINVPLQALLRFAFDLPETQILGAPGALAEQRFDLDARSDAATDAALHALPPADGRAAKRQMLLRLFSERFGLKFHRETRELPIFALVAAKGGVKLEAAKGGRTIDTGHNQYAGLGVTVAELAEELARQTGRVVEDQTGLGGRYDIQLKWAAADDAGATGPTLFTALEEQLGLRLEPRKGPVPVVVVEHLKAPSAN